MPSYSVLVIGAGAAGLAAARTLHDVGHSVLILEARDRIGGRAWTNTDFAGSPLEFGAEFIHGEKASTHSLVEKAGLSVIPVVRAPNLWWGEDSSPAIPRAKLLPELQDAISSLYDDCHKLAQIELRTDLSLSEYLKGCGWSDEQIRMADVLLAQTCCAPIDSLSCQDLINEMKADYAGSGDFRILEGYARLFEWYSQNLLIRFNTLVTAIRWKNGQVNVTAGNETFQAKACIVTIPVSLLQRAAIQFDPPLPDDKGQAIAAMRMEPATKLIYHFRKPLWDTEALTYMAHDGKLARWWTPGYRRPGVHIMASYVTAERARWLDALDEQDALQYGMKELSQLLGVSTGDIQNQLMGAKRVAWAADALALGGYAYVPTGAADSREILARPVENVLYFAGEATAYDSNPQTVHGAIDSGVRAAREYINAL
jgi:monoamine oxidase